MSVRGVWVISQAGVSDGGRLLFSRRFPTVEKRSRMVDGSDYVPVPNNQEFVSNLCTELGLKGKAGKFLSKRDSCLKIDQKPIFEVITSHGNLWPVLVVEQFGVLFCCIPLVEQGCSGRPPAIQIPGLSAGFTLLLGMADCLGPVSKLDEKSPKFEELSLFLSQAASFGRVRDVRVSSVTAKLLSRGTTLSKQTVQPAWKPVLHKGKNQVYFNIREQIRAVQYDNASIADQWNLYGTVTCRAELEGVLPEITLNVTHMSDAPALPLDYLLTHPCVQSAEAQGLDPDDLNRGGRAMPRRLRFTPPVDTCTVCRYAVSSLMELPIKGLYQMRMEDRVSNLEVKLQLNERVKNAFDYCELQLPFFNRGVIQTYDCSASQGTVLLSPDKRIVVWNIGSRFPPKTLEVTLTCTLRFSDPGQRSAAMFEDPFCVGQNAYAQLYFKIPDFSHSGCYVDPKSVQVSPSTKFKLTTEREYLSAEYKIWNSHGDSLMVFPPPTFPLDAS
ncbi:AP-5 complex subunit mu-1-like [Liolophura sinensis]|uniref:AP-5 complex subunit mu-1-like n=1 Tax=Liolophura sinensis TaxID=3198878 RepID=UPI0031590DE5